MFGKVFGKSLRPTTSATCLHRFYLMYVHVFDWLFFVAVISDVLHLAPRVWVKLNSHHIILRLLLKRRWSGRHQGSSFMSRVLLRTHSNLWIGGVAFTGGRFLKLGEYVHDFLLVLLLREVPLVRRRGDVSHWFSSNWFMSLFRPHFVLN